MPANQILAQKICAVNQGPTQRKDTKTLAKSIEIAKFMIK